MTDPNPVDLLIIEALAELRCARNEHDHSPNSDTHLTVEYAELRLNRLLDRRQKTGKREPVKSR